MKPLKTLRSFTTAQFFIGISWGLLTVLIIRFFYNETLPYYFFDQEIFHRFWQFRIPLIIHISGGILALAVAPFQFSQRFRTRYIKTHRLLGKIYVLSILISSLVAIYLTWTSALAVHWTWAVALQGLGLAWILTTLMAYITVKRGDLAAHRSWMLKSFIVTFVAVSFRVIYFDIIPFNALGTFVERAPTLVWLSWSVPILIVDFIIQLRKYSNALKR